MITIVPYDEAWPSAFQSEAKLIRSALGPLARRVEHVGSTSIPGIAAKPVIDIQVSVPTLEPLSTYVQSLSPLGYIHFALGDFDLIYPFFQKPATWPSTHHVHLCVEGSDLERKHIAFRDYLRSHAEVATEYVALKHKLAAENHGTTLESRERYSLSKSDFVAAVLKMALSQNPSLP
jgi:GrpB-like predicted nucleotidyltransferase (UPF0157 family)